jgi:arylsulfatase A-like enzyme
VDLYPTLADLAGLKPPGPLDGRSLVPVLDEPARTVRESAFTQAWDGYSVRTDRWRYVEWDEGRKGRQLYDMANDPHEMRDLASEPQHSEMVADLSARLRTYRGK